MRRLKNFILALLALGSMTLAPDASAALKVLSWNIQVFGAQKINGAENADVMKLIVDTIRQYDLVLVQEFRDPTGTTLKDLEFKVNAVSGKAFGILVSHRLGRASSKEQYVYLYRKSALKVVDSYPYADADDVFDREPFIARFTTTGASVKDFFVVPLHAAPESAAKEIGALVKVYDDAVRRWGVKNAVIMGDMEADCDYFSKSDKEKSPLRTDLRFSWLVPDEADTTTKSTDCAYDRVVVAGEKMRANATQAQVVDFQHQLNLSQMDTERVSDHFPIEFVIK